MPRQILVKFSFTKFN